MSLVLIGIFDLQNWRVKNLTPKHPGHSGLWGRITPPNSIIHVGTPRISKAWGQSTEELVKLCVVCLTIDIVNKSVLWPPWQNQNCLGPHNWKNLQNESISFHLPQVVNTIPPKTCECSLKARTAWNLDPFLFSNASIFDQKIPHWRSNFWHLNAVCKAISWAPATECGDSSNWPGDLVLGGTGGSWSRKGHSWNLWKWPSTRQRTRQLVGEPMFGFRECFCCLLLVG